MARTGVYADGWEPVSQAGSWSEAQAWVRSGGGAVELASSELQAAPSSGASPSLQAARAPSSGDQQVHNGPQGCASSASRTMPTPSPSVRNGDKTRCWGRDLQQLCGSPQYAHECDPITSVTKSFMSRFCAACHRHGFFIPLAFVRGVLPTVPTAVSLPSFHPAPCIHLQPLCHASAAVPHTAVSQPAVQHAVCTPSHSALTMERGSGRRMARAAASG